MSNTNIEIISVHIPKTAGTSLRNMILQHYGSDRVCTHYPDSPEVDGTREPTDSTKVIQTVVSTKSFSCLANAKPSPPLLPLPQKINMFGSS